MTQQEETKAAIKLLWALRERGADNSEADLVLRQALAVWLEGNRQHAPKGPRGGDGSMTKMLCARCFRIARILGWRAVGLAGNETRCEACKYFEYYGDHYVYAELQRLRYALYSLAEVLDEVSEAVGGSE